MLVSGAILPATGLRPGVAWPAAVRFTAARAHATYFMGDHAASLFSGGLGDAMSCSFVGPRRYLTTKGGACSVLKRVSERDF